MVITDVVRFGEAATLARAREVCSAGRPGSIVVQLRDRDLPERDRLKLGCALRTITATHEQRLVINDRIDVALLLGADGVHLGEHSVSVHEARSLLPPRAWISQARHSIEDAGSSSADAVVLSPVMASRKGRPPMGLGALHQLSQRLARRREGRCRTALFALGGVDETHAAACLAAGATGVAVIGAVFSRGAGAALLRALEIERQQ